MRDFEEFFLHRGVLLSRRMLLLFFLFVVVVPTSLVWGRPSKKKGRRAIRRLARKVPLMRLVYRVRLGGIRMQYREALRVRRIGEKRAIPYVLSMLSTSHSQWQRGALLVLGYSGLKWAAPLIWPFLSSRDRVLRRVAIEALQHLKTGAAAPHLLKRLKSASRLEAIRLLKALSAIGGKGMLEELNRIARRRKLPPRSLSLIRATLGDRRQRAWWRERLSRKHHARIGYFLGIWPGIWSGRLLMGAFDGAVSAERYRLARWLALNLDEERSQFLQKACQQGKLSKRFCRRLHSRLQPWLAPPLSLPKPFFLRSPDERRLTLRRLHRIHRNFEERFVAISDLMLGTPYRLDPLGEGRRGRFDRDPLFSFQRVDCVTFLEEILALSFQSDLSQAIQLAQYLRYNGGRIDYRYRRHLPLSQWLPELMQLGLLRDDTRRVAGRAARMIQKWLSRRSYSTRSARRFVRKIGWRHLVTGKFTLPYIPLERALRKVRFFSPISIMSMMRPDKPYSPDLIFHQGAIVRIDGILYLRHATKVWGGVVDTPLQWYLRSLTRYGRPVLGIHLARVLPSFDARQFFNPFHKEK